MGMLRRADIQDVAREALVMNLADMAREGREIVAEARREAEVILADARAERKRLITDAVEEGHARGHAEGLEVGCTEGELLGKEAARTEHAEALQRIGQGLEESIALFDRERERSLVALRRDALKLAVEIAERVVKRSITFDHELVARQVEATIGMLARPTRLVLEVHPADESLIRAMLPDLIRRFAEATHVDLMTDPALERGSCVVRTDAGATIDGSMRTQLERLTAMIAPLGVSEAGVGAAATEALGEAEINARSAPAKAGEEQGASRAPMSAGDADGASRSAA